MHLINWINLYLIAITIAEVSFSVRIRTLSRTSYTKTLFLLSIAICFYILGYTMELNSSTQEQIEFWNHIEYIGIPFITPLWMTVSLIYTGHFNRRKKLMVAAIYTIPVLSLIFRFTDDHLHFYYQCTGFMEEFGRLIFIKQTGPWMHVQGIYSAVMIIAALILFIADIIKSGQKQWGKLLLLGIASAFAMTGLILTQIVPFKAIDYMALFLPATCTIVMMAIFCYDFLEIKALARSKTFESSSNAILLINYQNRIVDYNKSAETLFSQINIQMTTENLFSVFEKRPEMAKDIVNDKPSVAELYIGNEKHYYNIITEKIDGRKILYGWVKIFHDVTEMYQLNEVLRKLAMTDELSVLDNRRAFIEKGKEQIKDAEKQGYSLHMVMLDLDYFKKINDRYGHPAGDLVIRDFSQILKKHFNTNCQGARLGGEEFAVLLARYTTEEVSAMIGGFLLEAEKHVYSYFENQFHVTVSVGMTSWQPGQTLEYIMRQSDKALYRSKAQGRNRATVLCEK